jgi:predicted MFS family arabinose efflux permease
MPNSNDATPVAVAAPAELTFARLIGTGIVTKLFVNTGIQLWGPFLPIIAQGLNTSVVVMGQLVSVRSLMGIFAPLFGSAADRRGYRRIIRICLWLSALGSIIFGLSPNILVALIGMILMGLGASGFVPTLQAYVSAQLPYSRRARGIGMLEYAWALTGIFGLFLIGQLIAATNWRVPFFVLATGMIVMSFVFDRMPSARSDHAPTAATESDDAPLAERVRGFFRLDSNVRSTYAAITASSFVYFAAVQLMISYGIWLEQEYGLGAAQLGTVALILGVFDLSASVTVSLATDQIGKKRSVAIGVGGAMAACLLLPFLAQGLVLAVLALSVARAFFEFAIVSNITLLSEQVPTQRGKVMTLGAAVNLMGATLAGLTAPRLFTAFGIGAVTWTSALCAGVSLTVLLLLVREHGQGEMIAVHAPIE